MDSITDSSWIGWMAYHGCVLDLEYFHAEEGMSEWSEWQAHDGKHCPVGVYVQTHSHEDDEVWEGIAGLEPGATIPGPSAWLWALFEEGQPQYGDVIEFRIRKPKGLTILESILNDLPAPTKPTVPA